MTLTLKNLYRLLTRPDYPQYNYPVFPEAALKGQTLVRFWYRFFQAALPAELDLTVFEPSEHQNRTLTRLLNRTGSPGMMGKWFGELSNMLDQRQLFRLLQAWMDRLTEWSYQSETLTRRLDAYIADLINGHDVPGPELETFFRRLADGLTAVNSVDTPMLFRHSAVLCWLTLYALYGSRMTDPALDRLRAMTDRPFPVLYERYLSVRDNRLPRVITGGDCVLKSQPLPAQMYFGYRSEIEAAMEALR